MQRKYYYRLIVLLMFLLLFLGIVFIFQKKEPVPDLHDLCSQMVMVGVDLRYFNEVKATSILQKYPFTGVILYDSSINYPKKYSFNELKNIITKIKKNLSNQALVAIDQEGGYVQRLRKANGFTDYPSAYNLGISQEPAEVVDVSRQIALELRQLGINLNLAPVVDLNNFKNPVIGKLKRSFSSDPEKVYRYALSFIKGHQLEGVYCCLKHFPGHGSSIKDTHKGLADVTQVYSRRELKPFHKLAGKVDFIMMSHTYNQHFDHIWPASLSKKTIDILRKEFKFNQVIITDDLLMGAIANLQSAKGTKLSFPEIVIQAVNAGNDILLFCDNFYYGQQAVEVIKKAVESGEIDYQTVYGAYQRIKRVKNKLNKVISEK